jgi:hypothetical protein
MIQKISPAGQGFRGVVNYALGPKKSPEIVASSMAGQDPRSLAREFGFAREANEAVTKPVFHASLSADPTDQVTPGQWWSIAETYMEKMGYGESLWVAVRHRDTEHDHIHLIASRISHDGSRVKDFQDRKRGEAIVRDLEREHGLHQVAPSRKAERTAITRDELAAFERTGEVSVKTRLQEHLAIAARDQPTMGEFAERLAAQGVALRVQVASTGRVSGISFQLDEVAFKGSDLGRAYSWKGLQEKLGVSYEASRDLSTLQELSQPWPKPRPREVEPAAAPAAMPPLAKPVEAYREAAVLVACMDLHERETKIDDALWSLSGVFAQADNAVEERARTEDYLTRKEGEAFRSLPSVYEDPQAAQERLRGLIEAHGYAQAVQTLEQAPADLGRLRGFGVGTLRTDARREAEQSASYIGRQLDEVGKRRTSLAAGESRQAEILARVPKAEKQRSILWAMADRLPKGEGPAGLPPGDADGKGPLSRSG